MCIVFNNTFLYMIGFFASQVYDENNGRLWTEYEFCTFVNTTFPAPTCLSQNELITIIEPDPDWKNSITLPELSRNEQFSIIIIESGAKYVPWDGILRWLLNTLQWVKLYLHRSE